MTAVARVLGVGLLVLAGGCAIEPKVEADLNHDPNSRGQEKKVYADLIRGMLAQGQYYAALAHIEQHQRSYGNDDEIRLLEAHTRRYLGQVNGAYALYKNLLKGRYAGEAYHGMGLLYTSRDVGTAIGLLKSAVQRGPTNLDFRNDLGYALMLAGRYQEALPELATAVELGPGLSKARNNLIILLMLTGDESGVRRVAREAGVNEPELTALRAQADGIRPRPVSKKS